MCKVKLGLVKLELGLGQTIKEAMWIATDNWNTTGEYNNYEAVCTLYSVLDDVEGVILNGVPLFQKDFMWLRSYVQENIDNVEITEHTLIDATKFILSNNDGLELILEVM